MNIGKKYPFFDELPDDKKSNELSNVLANITPIQIACIEKVLFVSCKIKNALSNKSAYEYRILKIVDKIIEDEYFPFNKVIHNFRIAAIESSYFLICCGMDINTIQGKNGPEIQVLSSIKIYDATLLVDKTHKLSHKKMEAFQVRQINLIRSIDDCANYFMGSFIPIGYETVQNIISFNFTSRVDKIAIGLDMADIVLIEASPNIVECSERDLKIRLLDSIDTDLHITNLAFSDFIHNQTVLYATTTKHLFFYKLYNNSDDEKLFMLNDTAGAYSGCIDIKGNRLLFGSTDQTQILEYISLELGPSSSFEGKKQFACYFNTSIVTVLLDESTTVLAIYDFVNKYFSYYNQILSKVYCVCSDHENVYAIIESNFSNKRLLCLTEKDNTYKFNTFFKKKHFNIALDFAKSVGLDGQSIADIHLKYGDLFFHQGDLDKAIEQYIKTINFIEPSIIVQKFLEHHEHLIMYLEALHNEKYFLHKSRNQRKDYTSLLLNCYIKQKQINKLKKFIDGSSSEDSPQLLMNVEIAIEVCIEENQIDLAIVIAEKAKYYDYYIKLLIEYKSKIYILIFRQLQAGLRVLPKDRVEGHYIRAAQKVRNINAEILP